MSVRSQLCNIVKDLKSEYNLTYDEIVTLGQGAYHKSQLVSVMKHNGNNVSVEVKRTSGSIGIKGLRLY